MHAINASWQNYSYAHEDYLKNVTRNKTADDEGNGQTSSQAYIETGQPRGN